VKYRVPPLWPTYVGGKEDNICQSIWDKSEVLWRTCWGTYWELGEHIENLMRTPWELKRNTVGRLARFSFWFFLKKTVFNADALIEHKKSMGI